MTKTPSSSDNLFANLTGPKTVVTEDPLDLSSMPEPSEGELTFEPESEEEEDYSSNQEFALLKGRANMMGLAYDPAITVEDLREKVRAHLLAPVGKTPEPEKEVVPLAALKPDLPVTNTGKPESLRSRLMRENLKLVRLRITNLDPADKDLQGNIYTVANEVIGAVRKYVPFGEATDNGYHVPFIIYKFLKGQVFTQYKTIKGTNGQKERIEAKEVRKFAMEILPQLTPQEISRLAAAQTAGGFNQE